MFCRSAIACLLTAMLALEILPCVCIDDSLPALGAKGGLTCRFEPLQVCDSGDPLLGAWANLPVLVPGAPLLFLSREFLCLVPEGASTTPDGYLPVIDHPPRSLGSS